MRSSTLALLLSALLLGCSGEEPGEGNMSINRAEESTTTKDSNQVFESTGTEGPSKPTADSEPVPEMQFERELAFGSTDEVVIGTIATFAVDDND